MIFDCVGPHQSGGYASMIKRIEYHVFKKYDEAGYIRRVIEELKVPTQTE